MVLTEEQRKRVLSERKKIKAAKEEILKEIDLDIRKSEELGIGHPNELTQRQHELFDKLHLKDLELRAYEDLLTGNDPLKIKKDLLNENLKGLRREEDGIKRELCNIDVIQKIASRLLV